MSHKWFKHMANGAHSDTALALAEEKLGHSGYTMIFKLRELMAAQTPYDSGLPSCEITRKRLCKTLGCRDSKLQEFIEVIRDSGEFQIDQTGEQLRFQCANFQLLLNSKAVSSAQRIPRLAPNRDKNDLSEMIKNEEKVPENNQSLDASSNFFWEEVNLLLTNNGTIVLKQLPEILRNHFSENGPDEDIKNRLVNLIKKRFRGSEKAETLGNDICARLNAIYKFAVTKAQKMELAKEKQEIEKQEQQKRKNAPEIINPRCKAVIDKFTYNRIKHIEKTELHYAVNQLIDYWGEGVVRGRWKKMMDYYDNYDSIMAEIEDDEADSCYNDDDPTPSMLAARAAAKKNKKQSLAVPSDKIKYNHQSRKL